MWDWKDSLDSFDNLNITNLERMIKSRNWDKIVTHNPIGEYGHPQHKLIFEAIKIITQDFYVFGKSPQKIDLNILTKKVKALSFYVSEKEIIHQILHKNGDWFKSNDDSTNYIENESIEKYNPLKDTTPFVACYDK